MYELGPYEITDEEYAYLMCTYKRQVMESLGIEEKYLNSVMSSESNMTYAQYIETAYRESFNQSVYRLLYAQAMFDEYDLSLSDSEKNSIKSTANAIVYYYGNGSADAFDELVRDYGFTNDTLFSVYEKQAKESAVVAHLLGDKYSKVTDEEKNIFYKDEYIHFQVIVVNTLYQKNENGTYSNLTQGQRETMLKIETELIELLCRENYAYNYEVLPKLLGKDDMSKVTYEELWANDIINDDMTYAGGYYMQKPNMYQMSTVNTLSQAMLTLEGDVSSVAAKRFFDGNGSIVLDGKTESVKEGDYFQYGTAFIKRLAIDEGAWNNPANKDFFPSEEFLAGAASNMFVNIIQSFEQSCPYTLMVDTELTASFSLATIPPNYIDYDYFHPSEDEESK